MKRLTAAAAALILLVSCTPNTVPAGNTPDSAARDYGFRRTADPGSYTDITFTEWSTGEAAAALPAQPEREHTLLIYMNGSDLESESGAATDDINEMLRSGADTSRLNIILFTGGANRWQTDAVPADQCMLSRIVDGKMEKLAGVGQRNMGDAGTLASFIKYGLEYFPAERYSLILWDHGGGSIAGYGGDENFNNATLSLLEMEYAFERAGLDDRRLEILGFDACLMASVEMAVVASDYAKYLVASETLEPQDGWDYGVLARLGREPSMDGGAFGKIITDAFVRYDGTYPPEEIALSVVRLDEAENVMGAMGLLMERCKDGLTNGEPGFNTLARYRSGTKSFGGGTPEDADCDMVDLLDAARSLSAVFPDEAAALQETLSRAVVYNKYISAAELGGLSAYYIYGGQTEPENALEVYRSLSMSGEYTEYLTAFAARLYDGGYTRIPHRSIAANLLGEETRLYEIASPPDGVLYAAAAEVNGEPADILVYVRNGASEGGVLGYRREDGHVIQKGYFPFSDSDEIVLLPG